MNVEALHQFVASVPGTFGQLLSRRLAVNMVAAGRVDAVRALQGLVGPDHGTALIPMLVDLGASPDAIRAAIRYAVTHYHRELPRLIGAHGGRSAFTTWCRYGAFPAVETLPETVDVYRGTMGCSPAEAAEGLHWSPKFDSAALFAARYADEDGTGMIVLHATVRRDQIAYYLGDDGVHAEIIPAEVPRSYEVIADKCRIVDGATRAIAHNRSLLELGYVESPSYGAVEQAALATRARMAAAGVPRGTAIVA